jgi:hypothetical protein
MPSLQQQAPHLASTHPLRRQAFVPRAGLDEHCRSDVYRSIRSISSVKHKPGSLQVCIVPFFSSPRLPFFILYFNDLLEKLLFVGTSAVASGTVIMAEASSFSSGHT